MSAGLEHPGHLSERSPISLRVGMQHIEAEHDIEALRPERQRLASTRT